MRLIGHEIRAGALALLVWVFSTPQQAYTYDAPGHYYTVGYALAQLNDPSPTWNRDRQVIAFCSWLPDTSVELSATGTLAAAASSYSTASGSNLDGWMALRMLFHPEGTYEIVHCWHDLDPGPINFDINTMQPVVIVQQLIHGLSGGDPMVISSIARDLASNLWAQAQREPNQGKRADLLCATGFALHLLGDSYAHRHLLDSDHNSEVPMYPTGCGHASAPSGGHLPDHPLDFGIRWKDWETYFSDIASVFGSTFRSTATTWFDGLSKPTSSSDDNECLLEGSLWAHISPALVQHPTSCSQPDLVPAPDFGIACGEYVRKWAQTHPLGVIPTCPGTWATYKTAALPLFARPGAIAQKFDYRKPPIGTARFYETANPEWQ